MIKDSINSFFDKRDTADLSWRFIVNFRAFCYRIINKQPNYLKKNIEFHNKYSGKRCFILGNGPSLNDLEFGLLKNEYVFTVNMLMDHEKFYDLNSNFHIMIDPVIFDVKEDSGLDKFHYVRKIDKLSKNKDVVLFAPFKCAHTIEKLGIDKNVNVRYLLDYEHYKSINSIAIDKTMPGFNKVIQYAIAIAIYMGFKEINLLGCEETNIIPYINLLMTGETDNDHCYKNTAEEKKSWINRVNSQGISWLFADQAKVFKRYELLSEYCRNNQIKLQNLTPCSLINSIDKASLDTVLGSNQE